MVKKGKHSMEFSNVYLKDAKTIGGPIEGAGPLGKYIDKITKNNYCSQKSWEKGEIYLLNECIKEIIDKNNDVEIEMAVLGDLNNQITASNYVMRNYHYPFFGVYSACSTFTESAIIGSVFIDSNEFDHILIGASSHNSTSERQFRSPTEYGGQKKITSTYTVTGAGIGLITKEPTKVKISKATIGEVYDALVKDPSDLGTAMAPAAALTLINHLDDFKIKPDEYDLILTGDLSKYGSKIFIDILNEHQLNITSIYNDCGLLIYDIDHQSVDAGGSGAAASTLVTLAYIKKLIEDGALNKVLIIATGALFNPIMTLQKETIPCIAHAIVLEGVR